MNRVVEMDSGGMIHLQSFMNTDSGVQVILRLLPKQF
jgi:hypothetical protein